MNKGSSTQDELYQHHSSNSETVLEKATKGEKKENKQCISLPQIITLKRLCNRVQERSKSSESLEQFETKLFQNVALN